MITRFFMKGGKESALLTGDALMGDWNKVLITAVQSIQHPHHAHVFSDHTCEGTILLAVLATADNLFSNNGIQRDGPAWFDYIIVHSKHGDD